MRGVVFVIVVASLISGNALGYELRKADDGGVLIWNTSRIDVTIDPTGMEAYPAAADAVRAGFFSWTSSGVPYQLNIEVEEGAANGGGNVVYWVESDWPYEEDVVAMTVSNFQTSNKFVTHSDILLNAVNYDWTTNPEQEGGRYDVENVVAHEAGHFFGLGHEPDDGSATMYPYTPAGEEAKRSLSADDLEGIAALLGEIDQRTDITVEGAEQGGQYPLGGTPDAPAEDETHAGGCSAHSSKPNVGSLLLVCGILFSLIRRRHRLSSVTPAVVSIMILASTAQATILREVPIDELADRADTVVQGTVVERYAVEVGARIFTEHRLQVVQCLRGACQNSEVILRTPGGELAGRGVHIDGVPRFNVGQQVVVFGQPQGHALRAVGLSQGLMRLDQGVATRDMRGVHIMRPGSTTGTRTLDLREGTLERYSLTQLEDLVRQSDLRRNLILP